MLFGKHVRLPCIITLTYLHTSTKFLENGEETVLEQLGRKNTGTGLGTFRRSDDSISKQTLQGRRGKGGSIEIHRKGILKRNVVTPGFGNS